MEIKLYLESFIETLNFKYKVFQYQYKAFKKKKNNMESSQKLQKHGSNVPKQDLIRSFH